MPKITNDDIVLFEGQLQRLRAAALDAIGQHVHQSGDPRELALPNHFAEVREQAEADLVADTEIGQLQIELTDLQAIDQALARIASGSFGLCTQCGGHIALRRLRVQPAAQRCLACQEALEQHRLPPR